VRVPLSLLIYSLFKSQIQLCAGAPLASRPGYSISQDAHELGKFRGEPVYSRSRVLQLKAAENWICHGRVVRKGEQPLKYVKQRAATINCRRELEIHAETEGANSGGTVMQGLYAEEQTESYVPPPVVNVRFPCRLREGAH